MYGGYHRHGAYLRQDPDRQPAALSVGETPLRSRSHGRSAAAGFGWGSAGKYRDSFCRKSSGESEFHRRPRHHGFRAGAVRHQDHRDIAGILVKGKLGNNRRHGLSRRDQKDFFSIAKDRRRVDGLRYAPVLADAPLS